MTRSRTTQPGYVSNALMATYCAQRAGAGLIVTEATPTSTLAKGYSFAPGIHEPAHIAGWKQVSAAVLAAGGPILLQLGHVGRVSHVSFYEDGKPVAPSAPI